MDETAAPVPAVLPQPRRLTTRPGTWRLRPEATLFATSDSRADAGPGPAGGPAAADDATAGPARTARRLLGTATGYPLPPGGQDADIQLRLDPAFDAPSSESYRLDVSPERAVITAGGPAGLVHGVQTLRQLLPTDIFRPAVVRGVPWEAPCVEIEDSPRFAWRGAHLDVSRHFLPADAVRRFVDLLALHKLNVLHLHLTDDQGWRFPSDAYPRLCDVGSWRRGTAVGWRGGDGLEETPHGGFYTKAELVDLVAYAADLGVTVMPEIEFPGHTQAVLAAYPEFGNGTGPYEVRTTWGIATQVLNLQPDTLEFCRTVLGEVMDIFPSPYIHVGGDEVPKDEWRASPLVQDRKRELGLADEDQLQHWFTSQLNAFLVAAGRRMVGWDEILEGGEPPEGCVVMSWRGIKGGIQAAKAGRDVVMCPYRPVYLDYYQSDRADEPLAIGGGNTLEDICAFEPVPDELGADAATRVLGSQVQLWSEYLPDRAAYDYMAFPRTTALADVLWHGGPDAAARLALIAGHLPRLDALGVNYRPLQGPLPWQQGGSGRRRRPPTD